MESRVGLPHRNAQRDFLHYKPRRSELDNGVVVRGSSKDMNLENPLSGKFNEKELMHGLNDRLAGFIEKVHQLEHHNHLLEREIEEIRGKAKPASCLEDEYGPELRKLREMVQDITRQKHQIEIEHENLEEELCKLRRQHEQEARSRSDAERNIMVLKKDINDAYQAKLQLDKKAQSLVDEIHFLKRNHEAEVSEMFDQIQDVQVTAKVQEFGNPGVTAALRDIRAQLEGHAVTDVQQVEETFRSQFARLTEAAESKREALKATQQEIQEYRRRMQAKNIELDCAKGTREALEKQLHDVEDRHKEELIHYQNTIKELENELINCKFDMSGYLREYQDLLNVKMALDVEILSYRKLLCGEEARLSSMSDSQISLPYIYHQSPVYTLPCLSRPGGPHRRAEPQYKFVEEIITETTREIEMSEFEETGSEETEAGKDEQECAKRDSGVSEEEENDNKDSGDAESEPMSDSQQIQAASVGDSVNGGGDEDGESPTEVDDSEKGGKGKEESVESEVVDIEVDGAVDKNPQNEVMSENIEEQRNEQQDKVAENTEEEKEIIKEKVEKDLSSKPDDLQLEVTVEDEPVKDRKEDAKKDNFTSVQVKKPADDTLIREVAKEVDKTQELSSAVQVEDEKTTDRTPETKSSLSKDTGEISEKHPVTSSAALKSEEKENGHMEQKEINKPEAVKGEDKEAKTIEDDKYDNNKIQNKELKPEVDDQKPDSGDKTDKKDRTVLLNEKTTASSETKELKQKEPEIIQAQKPELTEGSEKMKDHPGISEVESSKMEK